MLTCRLGNKLGGQVSSIMHWNSRPIILSLRSDVEVNGKKS